MKRSLALVLLAVLAMSTLLFAACDRKENEQQGITVEYSQLTSTGKEENTFAELFSIEHLKDENEKAYSKIEVFDKEKKLDTSWLLLPEGVDKVSGAPAGVNIMTFRDRQNIMVSSASTMALINAMDALSKVPMTTADTTWRIQEIKDAIDKGTVKEVGKYSKPDYEQIISIGAEKHVTFAVFSTMLDSVPDVYDQLTKTCNLRIMRDQSSYESHPLGRTEWIKIYGEIFDMRDKSDAVFNGQVEILNETTSKINVPEAERKTVLIFYTTSTKDTFYVRNAADYVTELVNLGGGKQVAEIGPGKSGNTKMTQESFIQECSQADYVLYNWTSGASGVKDESLQGLIDARLGDWFKDFKAYKEGNVWRTSNDFYQKMDKMGEMVADIYKMLYGKTCPIRLRT
ncbi:MAG: ABC transporter substrate-binding protein [Candidatus Borkfalkia sp.]